jgi:hypothetical protein
LFKLTLRKQEIELKSMEEETGGYPPERNKRNDVSELLLIE